MIKILFVCLGNICRSPMAEFIFRDLVKKNNREDEFLIESKGTSDEELGNPIYYLAKNKLNEHNISCEGKIAHTLDITDYHKFDYILAMDMDNIRDIKRIFNGDNEGKVYRLLDFTDNPRDIKDPWYTRDFDKSYEEILEGCIAFLNYLELKK